MSFAYIAQSYAKLRQHVKDYPLNAEQLAYRGVKSRIGAVRDLYLKWIDVYEEYRRGFEKEGLTRSLYPVAWMLSSFGLGLEENFFEVVRSRMPVEVYLLIEDCYDKFDCRTKFALAEGRGFESHTVYWEISKELEKLAFPKPVGTQANTHLTEIKDDDYTKIYYESGMYDSPLTWPLLLHEVFHDIYDQEKLQTQLKVPPTETWMREVIIDLYAAMFIGPVYAVSLAKYHERFPGGGGISHPHQGPRLFALLEFLREMVDQKSTFPGVLQTIISQSFAITDGIWSSYKTEKRDLQDRVSRVYEEIKAPASKFLESKHLQTFSEFAMKVSKGSEIGFPEVAMLLESGIPAAVDPRILFNALLLREQDPHPRYVVESLKKWYLSRVWTKAHDEMVQTLFAS